MPSIIYAEFSEPELLHIKATYGAPQDPDYHPYMADIPSDDHRYVFYYDNFPEFMRDFMVKPGE